MSDVRTDPAPPSDVAIRQARRSDVPDLSALAIRVYVDTVGHTFRPSDLTAYLEDNLSAARFNRAIDEDTILLAFVDDRLVGFIQFGDVKLPVEPRSPSDREIHRLYIDQAVQSRGVGSQLMDAALEDVRQRGAENVYLDVWEHNDGAMRFYERYGFEIVGSHRIDVESGAETDRDLIMVRRLQDAA